jgi:hypothetical protein
MLTVKALGTAQLLIQIRDLYNKKQLCVPEMSVADTNKGRIRFECNG